MLLSSKVLDICLERCASFGGVKALKQPLIKLLRALAGPLAEQEAESLIPVACAILDVAECFHTSKSEVSPQAIFGFSEYASYLSVKCLNWNARGR